MEIKEVTTEQPLLLLCHRVLRLFDADELRRNRGAGTASDIFQA
ncbi:hypothetical protein PRUB_a0197 [Pseudoalteromonas rubra]|uniref:Uncharacterized protein n=1 Tax=Pseudoalteromonas rubra TaxID=43658 RepID=A0A8T0C5Y9_9GAMM|nr:hypothetical protein PRUB_a0197 [Pseudoalteromonas rubra]